LRASVGVRDLKSGVDRRWVVLTIVCLGVIMMVLDSTIVNVALPALSSDLRLTAGALSWILNGYMIPFGGLLLFFGRLGDVIGRERVFVGGVVTFTLASLGCGLAPGALVLIAARIVQGASGAAVLAVALALIAAHFTAPKERARALSAFSFACAAGGSLGLILGGVLTAELGWRAIFLINVPLGIAVCVAFEVLVGRPPADSPNPLRSGAARAVALTLGLMTAVYAMLTASEAGWSSARTWYPLTAAVGLLVLFVAREARSSEPLIPPVLMRDGVFRTGIAAGVLWESTIFAWFFVTPLFLQSLAHYNSFQVGMAFLPANLAMGALSLWVAPRLTVRFGVRPPFVAGMLLMSLGLVLFARLPLHAQFGADILPGMLLVGLGSGIAYSPLVVGALRQVTVADYGIASGLLNSAFTIGGAIALAAFASCVALRSDHLLLEGASHSDAMLSAYHWVLALGSILAGIAALIGCAMAAERAPTAAVRDALTETA
jgi:EmrB/QacA subfamily drug resistance transporter